MEKGSAIKVLLIILLVVSIAGCDCSKNKKTVTPPKSVKVNVMMVVDDDTIDKGDLGSILWPVMLSVNPSDGEVVYRQGLSKFSGNQKYVLSMYWYGAEVNNGGHSQFFYNSTGGVWKDALEGFQKLGLTKNYEILKAAADKLGGNPSLDREKRIQQLESLSVDFNVLDKMFYATNPDSVILEFIKQHRNDFYFAANVSITKMQ